MNSPTGLEFEYATGCLKVRATSRAEFGQRVAFAQSIAEVIRKQPVTTLLVDSRRHILPKVQIAVLMREGQTDKQLIGNLVARNRGVELEVFFDPVESGAWLKKHQHLATSPLPSRPRLTCFALAVRSKCAC